MMTLRIVALALLISLTPLFSLTPLSALADDAAPPAIGALIEQLGAPEFKVREAAARALVARGAAALPGLTAATRSPNPEVARRAARAIKAIKTRLAEARARNGAPAVSIDLGQGLTLAAAARALSRRIGYAVEVDETISARTLTRPVQLENARVFAILRALSAAADIRFSLTTGGAVRLTPGPFAQTPHRIEGPFLAEVLWVERGHRQGFGGPPRPYARARVRLCWEPALRITGLGDSAGKVFSPVSDPTPIERTVTLEANARRLTLRSTFHLEQAGEMEILRWAVGHAPFVPAGGGPLRISMRSLSTSNTTMNVRFNLRGLQEAARDRALRFELEGANRRRVAPISRQLSGPIGARTCQLGFRFEPAFAPGHLLVELPKTVERRALSFDFGALELPK